MRVFNLSSLLVYESCSSAFFPAVYQKDLTPGFSQRLAPNVNKWFSVLFNNARVKFLMLLCTRELDHRG